MNPNSAHQTWSRWIACVTMRFDIVHARDSFSTIMTNETARAYRRMFGSATSLRIDKELLVFQGVTRLVVKCRTEGAPAYDQEFRRRRMAEIARFFGENLRRYGPVDVKVDVLVEAGETGDGTPRSQLILAPSIDVH